MIEVLEFDTSRAKGSYLGDITICITEWASLTIKNISVLESNEGNKFIRFPSRMKKTDEGKWVLDFYYVHLPKDNVGRFSNSCLKALEEFLNTQVTVGSGNDFEEPTNNDLPF